jgi:polyphosphate kinase 2
VQQRLQQRSLVREAREASDDELRSDWREGHYPYVHRLSRDAYERQKYRLQVELLKFQSWVKQTGEKLVILFEGRDAAGKGGTIKRFMEHLNPRGARVVALEKPSEAERGQWYFQRYVQHLPTAGEIVLFDRSWYNRAGVERVMGFASAEEVEQFYRDCPEYERMLLRNGIILIKYWFSVSDEEQDRRFQDRIDDPMKQWKFSDMDLEGRNRWEEYSRAKDEMLKYTDTKESPWWVVDGDDKRRARLNCIHHLLSLIPYEEIPHEVFTLPPRKAPSTGYMRPPIDSQTFVPKVY